LLDTHTFLWWNMGDERLSPRASQFIADGQNEIFLSAASAWEIAIKARRGRLVLPEQPAHYVVQRLARHHFQSLPVQLSHALHVFNLPDYHQDPFDRLLVAQSQLENLPLLTGDEAIKRYGVEIIW
jgi:PIN domain nuclease of toxin-antitoxin system